MALTKPSTSSEAKKAVVMLTVAPVRLELSESVTVIPLSTAMAVPVKLDEPEEAVTDGATLPDPSVKFAGFKVKAVAEFVQLASVETAVARFDLEPDVVPVY